MDKVCSVKNFFVSDKTLSISILIVMRNQYNTTKSNNGKLQLFYSTWKNLETVSLFRFEITN